jgi:hypothetical protein
MSQFKILLWRWEHAGIGKGKRISGIAASCPKLQINPFYRLNQLLDTAGFDDGRKRENSFSFQADVRKGAAVGALAGGAAPLRKS